MRASFAGFVARRRLRTLGMMFRVGPTDILLAEMTGPNIPPIARGVGTQTLVHNNAISESQPDRGDVKNPHGVGVLIQRGKCASLKMTEIA